MRFALVLLLTALLVTPALAKKKKGPGMDELLAELPRCESLETCPAALELIKACNAEEEEEKNLEGKNHYINWVLPIYY